MGYYYYDTPEGKDCDKKLFYVTKYALGSSIVYSTYNVLFYPTKGYGPTAARFAYNLFPFLGAAVAFTTFTCAGANLRKKDDYLNHMVAGAVSGSIIGAWRNSLPTGLGLAAIGAVSGAVLKLSVEEGWEFLPQPTVGREQQAFPDSHLSDYTMVKTTIQPKWTT
jgi:NADH dehydrogenase (ubiquinone) 1 alpha subcomplex subunit 11